MIIVFLGLVLEAIFEVSMPLASKLIIDNLTSHNSKDFITFIGIGLLCFSIIVWLFTILEDYLYTRIVSHVLRDLRSKIFHKLQYLTNISQNHNHISQYYDSDLLIIEEASRLTTSVFYNILTICLNISTMMYLNWQFTLISLTLWPFIFIVPYFFSRNLKQNIELKNKYLAALNDIVQEKIRLNVIIKLFALLPLYTKRFDTCNNNFSQTAFKVDFLIRGNQTSGGYSVSLLQIIILTIGAYMVYKGVITIGALVAFQALFELLSYSLVVINTSIAQLMKGAISLQRVEQFISQKVLTESNKNEVNIQAFSHSVNFNNISYSNSAKHILHNINLNVPKGKTIAIVGKTGAGKSTLLNLLMKFNNPSGGNITVDEINLLQISDSSWYSLVGYVSENNILINDTIKANICIGKPNASQDEIDKAAMAAGIYEDIKQMPEGYDTIINDNIDDNYYQITPRQKQRIAIARVIICSPQILLLDNMTAILDPQSEKVISATINGLINQQNTIIIIPHKLESIINTDYIYMMHNGSIVESGTHIELYDKGGYYRELWDKQHGFVINYTSSKASITVDKLASLSLFAGFPKNSIQEIVGLFNSINYDAEKVVFNENAQGDLFYIIAYGRVEVIKKVAEGKSERIGVLEDGDYFGEMALLNRSKRVATIKTITSCVFLTLTREDFIKLIDEKMPELRQIIQQNMQSYNLV